MMFKISPIRKWQVVGLVRTRFGPTELGSGKRHWQFTSIRNRACFVPFAALGTGWLNPRLDIGENGEVDLNRSAFVFDLHLNQDAKIELLGPPIANT